MTETEEIKSRLDIVDLVSEYVTLKQAGSNWKGLCPFHREKSPSFMVSKDKQIFKCFGCGESGDIFEFLMKLEGLDFVESLKNLAQRAGVKLEARSREDNTRRNTLLDIISVTSKLWNRLLLESPKAAHAKEYLHKRSIDDDQIEEFQLGYAPDSWDTTSIFLEKKGFEKKDIFDAGLTIQKDRGSGYYDRFRGRIIFPIFDIHGNAIAFGGRILKTDSEKQIAKYINSPQTLVYNKSAVVYNLNKARHNIKKMGYALVVEGYMDVLSCWKTGFTNVIASSGTAFTDLQIQTLKRYSDNLVLAFDADMAGQNAADRGIALALSLDMNLKIVKMPDGKDPDDAIKSDPEKFKRAVKEARSIMEYYFEKTLEKYSLNKVHERKRVKDDLLKIIAKISDSVESSFWLKKLSALVETPEELLREDLKKVPKESFVKSAQPNSAAVREEKPHDRNDRKVQLEERIIALVVAYPENIEYVIQTLDPQFFEDEKLAVLYKNIIIHYTSIKDFSAKLFEISDFKEHLSQKEDEASSHLVNYLDTLILLAEKDFLNFSKNQIHKEVSDSIVLLKSVYFDRKLLDLVRKLKAAEVAGDKNSIDEITKLVGEVYAEKSTLSSYDEL